MINAIINALVRRIAVVGIVMLGVGAYAAYDKYDKSANYVPVQARVTDIKEVCFMEKRSYRRREYSDTISCDLAEAAVKTSPKWQGFDVKHKITVAYEYISPVDKKTHAGKREYTAYSGAKLARGQLLNVRASKTDPNKSREG